MYAVFCTLFCTRDSAHLLFLGCSNSLLRRLQLYVQHQGTHLLVHARGSRVDKWVAAYQSTLLHEIYADIKSYFRAIVFLRSTQYCLHFNPSSAKTRLALQHHAKPVAHGNCTLGRPTRVRASVVLPSTIPCSFSCLVFPLSSSHRFLFIGFLPVPDNRLPLVLRGRTFLSFSSLSSFLFSLVSYPLPRSFLSSLLPPFAVLSITSATVAPAPQSHPFAPFPYST